MATLFWYIPEDSIEDNATLALLKTQFAHLFVTENTASCGKLSAVENDFAVDSGKLSLNNNTSSSNQKHRDINLSQPTKDLSVIHTNIEDSHEGTNAFSSYDFLVGFHKDWKVKLINEEEANILKKSFANAYKLVNKHGLNAFYQSELASFFAIDDCFIDAHAQTIVFDNIPKHLAGLSLPFEPKMKPLCLDYENLAYRQRLLRGGRQKEAVARAVLQGIDDKSIVFDATAGLGRESMILAHAGSKVLCFERQLPVWILLHDALLRASTSRYFPFELPELYKLGTIKDYFASDNKAFNDHLFPDVIYYDPMFPERGRSAQVKKEMFVFQKVVGQDLDTLDMLSFAIDHAIKRVVVKRPANEVPLETNIIKCAYSVDGGQCRFDCYEGRAIVS